jgi:hypothetical protein
MAIVLENDVKKLVNVESRRPIRVVSIPIRSAGNLNLTISDIHRCICEKAIVKEILDDGNLLRLDLANYNLDNNEIIRAKKQEAEAKAEAAEKAAKEAEEKEKAEKARALAAEKAAEEREAKLKADKEAADKAKQAAQQKPADVPKVEEKK